MERIRRMLAGERLREAFRFVVSGGVCFLLDYGAMYACKEFLGFHYLLATAVGFLSSVALNYLLCVKWVFAGASDTAARKALFLITSGIGLALSELLMLLFVDGMALHYLLAKLVTVALVMVFNYFAKRAVLRGKGR